MLGGTGGALWGIDSCLEILGAAYNVVWLVVAPSVSADGYFFYCVADGAARNDETRYAMLYADDNHYKAVQTTATQRGSFLKAELPHVVKDTWGHVDILSELWSNEQDET